SYSTTLPSPIPRDAFSRTWTIIHSDVDPTTDRLRMGFWRRRVDILLTISGGAAPSNCPVVGMANQMPFMGHKEWRMPQPALHVPSTQLVVSGDAVYNNTHLAECVKRLDANGCARSTELTLSNPRPW